MNDTLKHEILLHLEKTTASSDWTISGKTIDSRECQIFRASSLNHHHDIAIKVYRKNSPISDTHHNALEENERIFNQLSNEYRIPQSYGYLKQHQVYMMEWINAPTLQYRLLRFCYHNTKQQNDIARTFKWLKQYHLRYGELPEKPVDIEWYCIHLQSYLEKMDPNKKLQKNKVFSLGLETLKSKAQIFEKLVVPLAKTHGDFTPSNVLIDDKTTTCIDLHDCNSQPITDEISLQLSYLSTGYINMLSRRHMQSPPQEWELLNTALDAYGYSNSQIQREFLLYVFLYQLLRRWLVIFERNESRRTPILDIWSLWHKEIVVEGVSKVLLNLSKTETSTD